MIKFTPGITTPLKRSVIYSNRGMDLEEAINKSNEYYLSNNIACIYKKPTPIKILKAIKSNGSYRIKDAVFAKPSTTDYNGIYKGKYIDFEAKQTNSLTSFPLKNINSHQIKHLLVADSHGGVCFLIIRFKKLNKTFLVTIDTLKTILNNSLKSISLKIIEKVGIIIPSLYSCPLNYLEIVDKLLK